MFHKKEYVYEVYKTKNFSKAASNLYISQPALSAAIKKIENHLGSQIFDRSTTPIGLTECGEKYIQYVEQILEMEKELEQDLNNLNNLQTGHLTLGGSNLFSSYILPPLITTFKKQYPGIDVNLVETNTKSLEKQLFEGTLDLVIDNYHFSDTIYDRYFFCKEQLLLAVPSSFDSNNSLIDLQLTAKDIRLGKHSLSNTPSVNLTHFEKDAFLLLRSGNDTRERSDLLFKKYGMTPNTILKLDQQATAYHVCCQGMGITFITDTLIAQIPEDPRTIFYKLSDEICCRDIYFYRKHNKYLTRSIQEFLKQFSPLY